MTGNVTKARFAAEAEDWGYGSRTYDRFKEAGTWYNVPGESMRGSAQLEAHWADAKDDD
jgi:hypothetical protein